ncbi:YdcF family protein [Nocardia uniformis]|uniref:YdcF family protein n=1 Tax=Nocardia uniformis TaxID=53432 RepID=A0A849BR16_9NOCA|nr:YdcF family protein [Nocardia uniformis]NNH68514.1 YdcF family protein [Nocardia uniformis]
MRKRTWFTSTSLVLLLLWGEWANWRASRRFVGSATGPAEAVVVLGYRNTGTRANPMNRWRVRAGLRSVDPDAAESRLILCGGACAGPYSEAALMARYAVDTCGYRGEPVLEELSRSTWENIAFAIPYLEDVDRIKIVSIPMHAEKGRRYLLRQRPDLAARLVPGAEYRFGDWMPLKPLAALYGLRRDADRAASG